MKKKLKWMIPVFLVLVMISVFIIYTGTYYHADSAAAAALETDDSVTVSETGYGWLFDGPSEEDVLVFYPGAKVEETAYAPLMHLLAEKGLDVCLVKMPFRLAFFDTDRADDALEGTVYTNVYVGGHSLGGAMAAVYAAGNGEKLTGLILLAAYPTKDLDDDMKLLSIYGSEDGVLNMEKVQEGRIYAPDIYSEQVIEGGNHAQFGNYGIQKGDGDAEITPEEQQEKTADLIIRMVGQ